MKIQDIIEKYKNESTRIELPIFVGINEQNTLETASLNELNHILIGGSTGSGKSTFEHTIVKTLIELVPKEYVRFLLIDMKRVDLIIYNKLPNLICPVIYDSEKAFFQLEQLVIEKNKDIKSFKGKYKNTIVIIDTFSDLILFDKNRFEYVIEQLTYDSNKSGIHLIISDSRLSSEIYTDKIINLFPTKICFNVTNAQDAEFLLGRTESYADQLKGNGDLLYFARDTTTPIRLQAPSLK